MNRDTPREAKPVPLRRVVSGFCLAVLGACAGYSPTSVREGQSASEVVEQMGTPTGRYARPEGGERLEFARGPYGKHTFMVDLDASGRVVGWTQVLDESNFATLEPGATREEVLYRFGHPSEVYPIGWQKIDVWAYRYPTYFSLCQWWQVGMSRDGKVTGTSYGIDPRCDVGRNDGPARP